MDRAGNGATVRMFAIPLYRISSFFSKEGAAGKVISLICWRLNVLFNKCDISPHAKIGSGLVLVNPDGVVIGPVIIGKNAEIHPRVTLGRSHRCDEYGGPATRPQIGDNVIIYAGAVLRGGIKIGNDVKICVNAVVLKDIPDNSMALGVPAQIF